MYLLLLAVIYIAFISLGLPALSAGFRVAHYSCRVKTGIPLSYMGFVTMIISGGTIISGLMSERLTKKLGTRAVTTYKRVPHRCGYARLFHINGVLSALPVGYPLRTGRRRH